MTLPIQELLIVGGLGAILYSILFMDEKAESSDTAGSTDTTDIVMNPLNPGIFRQDFDQYDPATRDSMKEKKVRKEANSSNFHDYAVALATSAKFATRKAPVTKMGESVYMSDYREGDSVNRNI